MSGVHKPENPREWIARVRVRLASRRAEKPSTKAGQIKALWPEIEAALDKAKHEDHSQMAGGGSWSQARPHEPDFLHQPNSPTRGGKHAAV